MLRISLVFGSLAGLVVIGATIASIVLLKESHTGSPVLGYLIMMLALSLIFVGVKRYRDREMGGVIKFLPAFMVGLGIAVVAGIAYVAAWEVYLAATNHAFINEYAQMIIDAKKAEGVAGAALDAQIAEMESLKKLYADPLFRIPMTFLEIFPVGLLIALVSAALLRNSKLLPAHA